VDYKTEYENLLVGIIGYSSLRQTDTLNKKIVDPQESIQATKSKVTASDTFNYDTNKENFEKDDTLGRSEYFCYMLTPDQLMAVKDPSSEIIIDGDYSCGKTYVLKERTKQCAQKYPDKKIAYINLTYDGNMAPEHIMDMIAKNNFKDYNNVDVVTALDLKDHYDKHKDEIIDVEKYLLYGEDYSPVIKHFLKHSTYHFIFIDEMPPFRKAIPKHDLFSLDKSFFVTMKCDIYFNNKEWIKQMGERYNAKRINLKHNLRNSETILNLAVFFDNYDQMNTVSLIPSIPGPECSHYHNIHHLDAGMLARAAILRYFPHKPQESIVVLHASSYSTERLYDKLQKYFSTDRNIVYLPKLEKNDNEKNIREVKEYLEKPEGILVTDIDSFHGAQARNIIIIGYDDFYIRNMIMRTMSFAIIIHKKDVFKESVPGLVRDDNLHEYIHPGNTQQLFCENKDVEHIIICDWLTKDEDLASDSCSSSSDIEEGEELKS
jgi:hypothetical protein